MLLNWTKDCKTAEEKQKRQEIVRGSKNLLDILSKICYNSVLELECPTSFENPNWALEQAYRQGKKETLQTIIKMCTLEKDH